MLRVTRVETDGQERTLRRFVYLFVALAVIVLGWALWRVPADGPLEWQGVLLIIYVAALLLSQIKVRIRSTLRGVAPGSAAVLLCVAFGTPAQAILVAAAGTITGEVIRRRDPIKAAFNTSKEVLAAAAAAAVMWGLGFVPVTLADTAPSRGLLVSALIFIVAAVAYAVVDEVVITPVISRASGLTMRQVVTADWDIRLGVRIGGLIAAYVTYLVVLRNDWFLLVLPLFIYAVHLASAMQLRARSEREAWQRLAQATDEFNSVDLDGVLRTAVTRAADLFSVDGIEVEIREPSRLVRGDATGVSYDGPPADAPKADGQAIPIDLATNTDQESLGELRLLLRGEITLSERETYTLSTFAAALCTAIRNASTHAETKRLADSHARAAAIDPLTGLANRRKLLEYSAAVLTETPARGTTALLLIDLNHFKEINDTLGHSAGDQVLREIGTRLADAVQPHDLVARLGGDEFAILLVGLPAPALAVSRAHSLLAALNPPLELDGVRLSIEACGGVAVAPGDCDIEELLRRADVAMYQAKRDGQRVAVFARARDTADVGTLSLAGDLARAIAEDEFVVNFQPIVDLGSGEVIGAEALTRWAHPKRGDLSPAHFLDAVERSGQLSAFADIVLDQALQAAASWREAGFDLVVAVNVSPRSLLDPTFPDSVAARLSARDIPPAQVMVELTETVTLSQLEVVDEVLGRLRELGVQLALDDFGTGYSSLATLARVPVHELKIDRSFVAAMESPTEAAVVRSTIDLGRSLDLLVVAEGVETDQQRARLWELGCPTAQGHLFARPVRPERLLQMLRRGTNGRPGCLAAPLHEAGTVVRIPQSRRSRSNGNQTAEG
ncbi:hypothetical protein Val02_76810 [Virgisporangium aliadipatigenens]|uniref:Bifunctional diguanylate cyclase/phosphodiesterase n=1 Tax=Virgisporangium aliadipatigenens TaxID=741659 RepID=A0A8J3YVY3_9ACTN|nr:bifunctional diguanylate cyclase/phosphodiesterase [Virgisporangium aliadipatigenens]GIJ50795.1 hypothetical protein Val02_76810 [Virgisporangium aliadipatigenens]